MTKLEALQTLLAKVEAGGVINYQETLPLVREWRSPSEYFNITDDLEAAYNGSLDAAKALHEAVLPGFHFSIDSEDDGACVFDHLMGNAQVGKSNNPAPAWLIAIIKALITMETPEK